MQWLIDIILELVQPMLDALKVTIHGQLGYFDRGDPADNDFVIGDFTIDNTWRDLNLSAIVPADAKCVNLKLTIRRTLANGYCFLRTKGNVNDKNASYLRTQSANFWWGADCQVPLPANRIIQYKIQAGAWIDFNVCVKGWWLR